MRRRFARLAGVFALTLLALLGCGAQSMTSGAALGPAGQRAAATAHAPLLGARVAATARMAGPVAPAATAASTGKAWWQQILDVPRNPAVLGVEPRLGQWWRDATSSFTRQLHRRNSGQSLPKLPHSN